MNNYFVHDGLTYLAFGLAVVSVIIALTNFKKVNSKMRMFLFFLIISIASEVILTIMSHRGLHNFWLLNIYTLIEYSILGMFYLLLFRKTKYYGIIAILLSVILPFLIVVTIKQSITEYLNQITMATEAIVFIFLSVGYFYKMLIEMEFDSPFSNPIFWINAGVLVYFSGAFFFFMFSDLKYQTIGVWIVHNFIHVIFMLLITIGFWKVRKT